MSLQVIPVEAFGLQLCKMFGEDLRMCEPVMFTKGWKAVDTILRRAAIGGLVSFNTPLEDYWADILDANGDIIGHASLDRGSFNSLKNHWMRCKYEPSEDALRALVPLPTPTDRS